MNIQKVCMKLLVLIGGMYMVGIFATPLGGGKTIHTTLIHTGQSVAAGAVIMGVGKGDEHYCQPEKVLATFVLPRIQEGDTVKLTTADLPAENTYSCGIESYQFYPISAHNKQAVVLYRLNRAGGVYINAEPDHQEVNVVDSAS